MQATWRKQSLSFPETMQSISEQISPIITSTNQQKANTLHVAGQVGLQWICLTERGGGDLGLLISCYSSSKLLLNFVMVQYQALLGGR